MTEHVSYSIRYRNISLILYSESSSLSSAGPFWTQPVVNANIIFTSIRHTSLCNTASSKDHWCSLMIPIPMMFLKAPVEAFHCLSNASYFTRHAVIYLALFKYFLSMSRLKASSVAAASRALLLSAINSCCLENLKSHKSSRHSISIQLLETSHILKQKILCFKQGKA